MYFPVCFDSKVSVSDNKILLANSLRNCSCIRQPSTIVIALAKYKESPLVEKAKTIKIGINKA